MKISLTSILFPILLLGFAVTTTNCKKDDAPARDAFFSTYTVNENCAGTADAYTMQITTSSAGSNAVIISNLWNNGDQISGTVNGTTITIPNQTVFTTTYSGSGQLSGNILTLSFSITDLTIGVVQQCTATCAKK